VGEGGAVKPSAVGSQQDEEGGSEQGRCPRPFMCCSSQRATTAYALSAGQAEKDDRASDPPQRARGGNIGRMIKDQEGNG